MPAKNSNRKADFTACGFWLLLGCSVSVPASGFGSGEAGAGSESSGETGTGTRDPLTSISGDGSGTVEPTGTSTDGPDEPVDNCGDGVADPTEVCDGEDFKGEDCGSFGWDGGTLVCTPSCLVTTEECTGCGNDRLDGDETCDGSDLDGETCESLGFSEGPLSCADDCSEFETDECPPAPVCGNQVVEGTEECDGGALAGQDCVGLGFDEGTLACTNGCAFETSGCIDLCLPAGDPCTGPTDCCNTGCGAGGSTCNINGVSVCCS